MWFDSEANNRYLLKIDGCCNVTKLIDDLKVIGYGDDGSVNKSVLKGK